MSKKRLIKSIIGTVAIYGVLAAFLFILSKTIKPGLGELLIEPVPFVVCSFAAGLLFKGKMNALVWSAATEIFFVVICATSSGDWDFEAFMRALWFVVALLLIPFFIAKSIALSVNEGNERPAELETVNEKETQTGDKDTNKKALLKNIIGTVGIYLVLIASILILRNFLDILVHYIVYCGLLIACSIAAGVLFKGKIYARAWSAASVIFTSIMCEWHLEFIITIGVPFILMPLLIPFLIARAIVLSINEEKEPMQENPPRKAFKTALDDPKEKQNSD